MELMLESEDTASRERLSIKEEATTTQKKQQQNGVDGKLQIFVWDPEGFPTA